MKQFHAAPTKAAVVFVLCALSTTAFSKDNGLWSAALGAQYVITDVADGDVDGDGRTEHVYCYREQVTGLHQKGGLLITGDLENKAPLFHVQLDDAPCDKVRINGRKIALLLSGKKQLIWTYGEDFRFRTDRDSVLAKTLLRASTQSDSSHGAAAIFDGDTLTSWGEGASGTGLGQLVTLRFVKPLHVGLVGVFCGDGTSERAFFDHHRLHRGSIETKTESDLGDKTAGVDFAALGIDALGDRIEFTCENRPDVSYVKIDRQNVVELTVRVDSVYLGDKKDETRVAELDVVPVLLPTETLDRAKTISPSTKEPPPAVTPVPTPEKPTNDVLQQLDASGPPLIHAD
jgi:hypothetical protein